MQCALRGLQLDGYLELWKLELMKNWMESLRIDKMDDFVDWIELLK